MHYNDTGLLSTTVTSNFMELAASEDFILLVCNKTISVPAINNVVYFNYFTTDLFFNS